MKRERIWALAIDPHAGCSPLRVSSSETHDPVLDPGTWRIPQSFADTDSRERA
jgi:hypothetical protein